MKTIKISLGFHCPFSFDAFGSITEMSFDLAAVQQFHRVQLSPENWPVKIRVTKPKVHGSSSIVSCQT